MQDQDQVDLLNEILVTYYCVEIFNYDLYKNLDYAFIRTISDEKGMNCTSDEELYKFKGSDNEKLSIGDYECTEDGLKVYMHKYDFMEHGVK